MSDHTYVRSFEFRAEPAGDGLTLEGYAAVFDQPAPIRDWDGEYVETIVRGAFRKTLRERTPVVQFDHGQHPMFGSLPIAAVRDIREDKTGLFIRARMFDTPLFEPLRHAINEGAIDGMSFRFEVVKDVWTSDRKQREVREVKLFELGPVVFPAYAGTSVGLRALVGAADDDERPASLVVDGTPALRGDEPPEGTPAELEPPVAEPSALERVTREELARWGLRLRGVTDAASGAAA